MSLYLTIFDGEDEQSGVEVGPYSDFHDFRLAVEKFVEGGNWGSACPTLMLRSDCDGQWTPAESTVLLVELARIAERFHALPSEPITTAWKRACVETFGLKIGTLYDCFFDIDGEPLIERLQGLAQQSVDRNLPILFQ
ncbi:hypothetical protein C2U72_26605 [Prosthecomicrobium hirschii]|nr:hypothetical protein C2U72_26605 [Prosthecomicrobium hirschii]